MYNFIFQNKYFIILEKPSGVLSTPARDAKDSRPVLGRQLEDQLKTQIYPIHRLDFEVSGIIMYATTPESHKAANIWFENKWVQKTYRALSKPSLQIQLQNPKLNEEFEWKCLLLRGKKRAYESPAGKDSLTKAKFKGVLGESELALTERAMQEINLNQKGLNQWDLMPITGRSHQLRYEMYKHEMPILGDTLYGSDVKLKENTIALKAYRLQFGPQCNLEKWGLNSCYEISPQIKI